MEIVLIAALTRSRVIGNQGRVPWCHKADMCFFRRVTWGHPVIMGRVTYQSLPRRPLPGRTNIVLSRQKNVALPNAAIRCQSLEEALHWCRAAGASRVFVAGGADLYRQALPVATCMLLTWVPEDASGDARFPQWDAAAWEMIDSRQEDGLIFDIYRRVHPPAYPWQAASPSPQWKAKGPMLERLDMAPPDPILGLTAAFKADPAPDKINLGVGVYQDDQGRTPVPEVVRRAEKRVFEAETTKSYLPIDGSPEFVCAVQTLLLGDGHRLLSERRAVTLQTPGGTGALRVAGDFIHQHFPHATLWLSDPTWANHPKVFAAAGVPVQTYPYFDAESSGLDFGRMLGEVRRMPPGDILLLHGCCHNPTGVDPDPEQWEELAEAIRERDVLPLVDLAYQGLGDGLRQDARGLTALCGENAELLVASSFSKNFGLYRERVGALTLIASEPEAAERALSHLKIAVRTNYSNPPAHGSAIVIEVLTDPHLRREWEAEVNAMRQRIQDMRRLFVETLQAKGVKRDFSFINRQRGMFSYSGLTPGQVQRLREEFSIYIVGSGRINVAGMTTENMDQLCQAIAAVL